MGTLLQGHIAAVTGAGSGIGQAIAQGYAREGAQVVAIDMNAGAAAAAAKSIADEPRASTATCGPRRMC